MPGGKNLQVRLLHSVLALLLLPGVRAYAGVPSIMGQVTAAASPVDFEVNGIHVLCDASTKFLAEPSTAASRISWSEKPYLGEPLRIYGRQDHRRNAVLARRVVFAPFEGKLSGKGLIDRLLAPQPAGSLLVRADGYPILLTPATQLSFSEPLHTLDDVRTNTWLEYQGHQRQDGVLVAEKAALHPNTISDREDRLRDKYDYDPAAVPAQAHDNALLRYVVGANPRNLAPAQDQAMQDRIEAIGERLIPAYQRALPENDPTRISFQFQLIEQGRALGAIWLPNGTILLPSEQAARMQNDDQIAAYLSIGVAGVLEKQQLRFERTKLLLNVAQAGAGNVPVLEAGFLAEGFFAETEENIETAESQQRIRVALTLMHDAGYDLKEAPKALWLLASKKPEPISNIPIPDEAIYAYAMLGAIWRDTAWEQAAP